MPLYEYECGRCGHRQEVLLAVNAVVDTVDCPACWGTAKRIFSTTKIGQGQPERIEQPSAHTPEWKRERFRKETQAQNRQAGKDFKKLQQQASGRNPSNANL